MCDSLIYCLLQSKQTQTCLARNRIKLPVRIHQNREGVFQVSGLCQICLSLCQH